MKRLLTCEKNRTALYLAATCVLVAFAAASVFAQPKGFLRDGDAPANVGRTPKWTVTLYAEGRAVRAWCSNEVGYLGYGVFSFKEDTGREVMVSGAVVVEANW